MTIDYELAARKLWARVVKDGPIMRPELGACWVWTGGRTRAGYGVVSLGKRGVTVYAHRLSYELKHGPIPDGLCVLHSCDHPPCVRDDHHFLGTHTDNSDDKVAKNRQAKGEATGGAVLTDAKVAEILVAYATGEFSVLALAGEYGVTEATLRAIVNGKTWTHVEGPRLTRAEVVAIGKRNRATARLAAKLAMGWAPGACSRCRQRGHYAKTCTGTPHVGTVAA